MDGAALQEQTEKKAQEDSEAAVGFVEALEQRYPISVLETLLQDQTTGKNIIWADDEYEALGEGYGREDEITIDAIAGTNTGVIKPRIAKDRERQSARIKNHAEVFTPSWLCNQMNNYLDEEWFGRPDVFNTEGDNSWMTNHDPIEFPQEEGLGWQDYIASTRLEITCGEAPFICSRYDTVTGQDLPVSTRIGILDRKLRIVTENTKSRDDWINWAMTALKSTYGYEYQGDNLVVARINVLETFIEHASDCWGEIPSEVEVTRAAHVVSWNIWQMDGLTCAVPSGKPVDSLQAALFDVDESEDGAVQPSLFGEDGGCDLPQSEDTTPLCMIFDWEENKPKRFVTLKNGALS